jgi:16S rRNA (guanine(1405)-N(7))-methyltransferase
VGDLDERTRNLLEKVLEKPKYRSIHPGLIASLIREETAKGRGEKEILKAVTGRLHQVGAAYFQRKPEYEKWSRHLAELPQDIDDKEVKAFCEEIMRSHSSTSERLPILERFFKETLGSIAPVESILDLACGLNPLAAAWMPLAGSFQYFGCDIFSDMTGFLKDFYIHMNLAGSFTTCDLTEMLFPQSAQVAFLLKTLPCLKQIDKGIGVELLDRIPAEHLLISYPVRSLGGRAKGMGKTYETQFNEIAALKGWKFERFEFASELAFLVTK